MCCLFVVILHLFKLVLCHFASHSLHFEVVSFLIKGILRLLLVVWGFYGHISSLCSCFVSHFTETELPGATIVATVFFHTGDEEMQSVQRSYNPLVSGPLPQ